MKRFRWPLQRLLEIEAGREKAIRVELFRFSRRIAATRQEIFRRQSSLRIALAALSRQEVEERLPRQQVFMRCSVAEEAELDQLRQKLDGLQRQRSETMAEFMRAKSSREALERLREKSLQRHTKEALRQEQKEQDESSRVLHARGLLEQRTGDGERGIRNDW